MSLVGGIPIILGYVSHQYRDELTSLKGLNYRQSLRAPRPCLCGIDHAHALPDHARGKGVS